MPILFENQVGTRGMTHSRSRSSYLAAPPLLRGEEHVEGGEILHELPMSTGLLLWRALRDVMLWVAEPDRRSEAFDPILGRGLPGTVGTLGLPIELSAAITILNGLNAAPIAIPEDEVAQACLALAGWAREARHRATELAYTQAAALLRPRDPALAHRVARLARDRSEYPRAETWYRKAIQLARRSDWDEYTLAYIGLANLYISVGNYPAARELSNLALRTSLRRGLKPYAGMAAHALFIIAAEGGNSREATDYAQLAFRHYGTGHPRTVPLAQDVATFWLNQGFFSRALPVLEALLPHVLDPDVRVIGLANAARAAAGVKARPQYAQYRQGALRELQQCNSDVRTADVLLAIAQAGALIGEVDHAEKAVVRVIEIASQRNLAQLLLQAESLRASIASDTANKRTLAAESIPTRQSATRLAEQLITSPESGVSAVRC